MIQSWLKRLYAAIFGTRTPGETTPGGPAPQEPAPEAPASPPHDSLDQEQPGTDASPPVEGAAAPPTIDKPFDALEDATRQDSTILSETAQEAPQENDDTPPETQADPTPQGPAEPATTFESDMPQEPLTPVASPNIASRPRRYRRSYRVQLNLAQRPLFCCCCIGLGAEDTRRLRRVLALTRAVVRNWR